MEINQENTKYLLNKSTKFLSFVFPGIVAIDLFFQKGFFSNSINTFYDFLLYVVWTLIISIPFHHFNVYSVEEFTKHVMKKVAKNRDYSAEESNKIYEELSDDDKELFSDYDADILLGLVIIKTILFYLLYKIFTYYNVITFSLFDIPCNYLLFALTIFATTLLGIPLGYLYAEYNIHKMTKGIEDDFFAN